jgi:tRNA dimethylallyltransferase
MTPPRIVALVGATATGKTAVAEVLGDLLDAEIVCADSRQLFRELEIGTGKPSVAERAARPHHLFDALALEERPSAGRYARDAAAACRVAHARGRMIVLVGGTGLYLRALRDGIAGEPEGVAAARAEVRARLEREGPEALHAELARVDPGTAARLSPRDTQRVGRALEVHVASGRPLSWWHATAHAPGLDAAWYVFELVLSPPSLAERIDARTRTMFDSGLVDETRALVHAGRGDALRALRAIGYDESLALLAGAIGRNEAETRTSQRTRRLAKRQRTWFRHQIEGASRIDADGAGAEALARTIVSRIGRG